MRIPFFLAIAAAVSLSSGSVLADIHEGPPGCDQYMVNSLIEHSVSEGQCGLDLAQCRKGSLSQPLNRSTLKRINNGMAACLTNFVNCIETAYDELDANMTTYANQC